MNVGNHLKRSVIWFSDRIAVISGKNQFTYRQFYDRVNRAANGLISLGLKKGDRVAFLSVNCHQIVEGLYGCLQAGLVRVPINSRLSPSEVIQQLNDSGARVLIMGHEFTKEIMPRREEIQSVEHYLPLSNTHESLTDYETLISSSVAAEPSMDIKLDDLATLNYTSGTSGVLKAASLTHRNLISQARRHCLISGVDFRRDSLMCHVAPISHASGGFILPIIWCGGCNLILPKFEPEILLHTIGTSGVTHLLLVPTMLSQLMTSPELKKHDLSSLRTILLIGSPPSHDLIRRAIKTFGPILIQGYGQTETSGGLIFLNKEDHFLKDDLISLRPVFPTGIPTVDYEVRVIDENGDDVQPGEVGEIIARGEGNMIGYWEDPELTAKTLRNGWVFTGDMATIDENNYTYIVDRMSDMIKSGGLKIYPSEVEKIICSHPAVVEAAVVGIPDDDWGESVKAVVVPEENERISEEELILFCKQKMASFKKPKSVDFVQKLPKNANGKLMRRELKMSYWKDQDKMVH